MQPRLAHNHTRNNHSRAGSCAPPTGSLANSIIQGSSPGSACPEPPKAVQSPLFRVSLRSRRRSPAAAAEFPLTRTEKGAVSRIKGRCSEAVKPILGGKGVCKKKGLAMDGVRYGLQQANWENSSALESYDSNLNPDLRGGGAYGDRGYIEGPFQAGPPYAQGAYPGEAGLDADMYPRHGWPASRRRSFEEEIALQRGSHRFEKLNQEREPFQRSKRDFSLERAGRDVPEVGFERVTSRTASRDRDNADADVDWDYRHDRLPYQEGREGNQDVDMAELPRPWSGTPSRLRRDEAASGIREEDLSPREISGRRSRGEDRDSSRRWRDRDYVRSRSRSRDRWSPDRGRGRDRDRSYGLDDRDYSRRFSRSPRSRSRGAGGRESSYDELRGERRRDRESTRYHAVSVLPPSATLVVKGLSQKICEDDLYLALADWGPLRHIRVIKERGTGVSRGFAFVDFPDVDSAQKMMDDIGYEGIVIDGRRICFEYSSKPTGGPGILPGPGRSSAMKSGLAAADWMCTVCGCKNFARRIVCFQCNEGRTDESPAADLTAAPGLGSRRTSEGGPTHVLVVRGLDETVDEESLHCEFSKYAPIKDLRLVRDKFTSVSRGFAFIHFHSVEDAGKALEATNGIALDKNGQLLRVAFANSIGPASTATSQVSAAAAAAIEAATFSQQYDMMGWTPKEYIPGESIETGVHRGAETEAGGVGDGESGAPQSGFVWDEASGYYYDAASGFYYDGNRGLYYDGNSGVWYTYDQETQQYTPYVAPEGTSTDVTKSVEASTPTTAPTTSSKAVIISAPAIVSVDMQAESRKPTLAEAVAAAAEAAKSSAKKDKEKLKEKEREIRKSMIIGAGKKKMNNVMSVWKQRQHEGLTSEETNPGPSSDNAMDGNPNSIALGRGSTVQSSARVNLQTASTPSIAVAGRGMSTLGRGGGNPFSGNYHPSEGAGRARPVTQSSGRGVSVFGVSNSASVQSGGSGGRGVGRGRGTETSLGGGASESPVVVTPFKTDASALGAFPNATTTPTARRRFTETPQSGYRDRAAERRSLYASTVPGDVSDADGKDKGKDMPFPPGVGARGVTGRAGSDMPFPPGVGGGGSKQGTDPNSSGAAVMGGAESESFEVITAEKALDASNVGNRMLRNMGWQEGSGLGKEGTGIVEPVLAQGAGERAGLGSQSQQKKTDSRFETLPGDSYRIVIQKKALARFHEMI